MKTESLMKKEGRGQKPEGLRGDDKLPQGWAIAKLKEITNIKYGKNLPTKYLVENGKYPVFGANGIIGYYDEYIYEKEQVLISCRGANSGVINYSPPECFITNNSLVLELINPNYIIPKLLYFALQSVDRTKLVTGTAQPQVTVENASPLEIPIAPLNEQKRIVAKLEKLLTKVNESCDRISRIPTILKRFRQSVLASACSGRLTADWRKQKQLIDNYDLPFGWKELCLGDTIEDLQQGWSPKCHVNSSPSEDIWGVIKTTAVQPMNFVEEENKELPSNLEPKKHLELKEGDILITRAGPRIRAGVSCLVRSVRPNLIVCDKVYRFHAKTEIAIPDFLVYFLNESKTISTIDELKTGISDSGVNLTQRKFQAMKITLPPLEEQKEIVKRVEALFRKCDLIEQRYLKAKAYTDKLTQSILAKAFRGELVPQDPNDEPAEVLLERIREEKTVTEKSSKGKKTSKRKTT